MTKDDSTVNGRATLRDIMQVQHLTNCELKEIRKDIAVIRAQSTRNTAIIAILVSLVTSLITGTLLYFVKGLF